MFTNEKHNTVAKRRNTRPRLRKWANRRDKRCCVGYKNLTTTEIQEAACFSFPRSYSMETIPTRTQRQIAERSLRPFPRWRSSFSRQMCIFFHFFPKIYPREVRKKNTRKNSMVWKISKRRGILSVIFFVISRIRAKFESYFRITAVKSSTQTTLQRR